MKVTSVKTSSKKNKESKKEEVTSSAKNAQKNVESLARDVKYIYPDEVKTKEERKKFRTKSRNAFRAFERKIAKAEGKDQKGLEKEFKSFLKETFVNGEKATIGN